MKTYKSLKAKAEKIEKTLGVGKDFKNVIYVNHLDGSRLQLNYATLKQDGDWYMIFTEHNGKFIYHKDDLKSVRIFVDGWEIVKLNDFWCCKIDNDADNKNDKTKKAKTNTSKSK